MQPRAPCVTHRHLTPRSLSNLPVVCLCILFDLAGEIPMSELVDSMQTLGFQDKNPMMFELMQSISSKMKGGPITFIQFAEDLADLIVSTEEQ